MSLNFCYDYIIPWAILLQVPCITNHFSIQQALTIFILEFLLQPGGYSTKFNMARLRPTVQPLTLLYNIFHRKGTPFVYLLLKNGTPFTYLVENFASLLTDINALSFNYESITNSEHFFDFFTAIKCIVSPFGLFREQKDRFLYLSYPSTCEIPFLIHT